MTEPAQQAVSQATIGWKEILTAILAIYGAGLSTWTFAVQQIDRRVKVRVGSMIGRYSGPGTPGGRQIYIEVVNTGRRPVKLTHVWLEVKGQTAQWVLPSGMQLLPKELTESQSVNFIHPVSDFFDSSPSHMEAGEVVVRPVWADTANRHHKGRWVRIPLKDKKA